MKSKKLTINSIFKIIEIIMFLILLYIIILTNSVKNISGLNSFIISIKNYIITLIFINYGIINYFDKTKKNIKDNFLYLFLVYFIIYLVFLFIDGNIQENIKLIPIELLGLQPIFSNIKFGMLYNSIWIINYFIIINGVYYLFENYKDKYLKRYDSYKKYILVLSVFFAGYLFFAKFTANIIFYLLLFLIGYLLFDIIPVFKNKNSDNKIIDYIYKLIMPLYVSSYLLIINGKSIIKLINKIGHLRSLLLYVFLFVVSLVIYCLVRLIIKGINKINITIKGVLVTLSAIIFLHILIMGFLTLYNQEKVLVTPKITITSPNEVMDLRNYKINGETNGNHIDVYINGKYIDTIIPLQKSFSYKVNDKLLNVGWNYIEFRSFDITSQLFAKSGGAINNIMDQPDTFIPDEIVITARKNNKKHRGKYRLYDDYEYYKDYIGAGLLAKNQNNKFDKDGVPLVKRDGEFYYNPVTISGQALGLYSVYLKDKSNTNKKAFLRVADWFVKNNENGALRYQFDFTIHGYPIYKGWTSGMAQGRALSVLARAYYITKDDVYLKVGKNILDYMLTSADNQKEGTSKSLYDFTNKFDELKEYNNYRLFEEYVTYPSGYVLNGDMFALLGLYDWSKAVSEEYGANLAKNAFEDGIKSVELLLPYYDYYGWSSYDLFQYTNNMLPHLDNNYAHRCHLQLLYIFYTKTNSEKLKKYVDIFENYYKDDFWIQSDKLYKGNE